MENGMLGAAAGRTGAGGGIETKEVNQIFSETGW
jgi:hypothetical protein